MIHYINISGKEVFFSFKREAIRVKPWQSIDLPDEVYDYIEEKKIPLEINYSLYIEEG